jgi:hypothetical protein
MVQTEQQMQINQTLISREGKYEAALNIHFYYSIQTCNRIGEQGGMWNVERGTWNWNQPLPNSFLPCLLFLLYSVT